MAAPLAVAGKIAAKKALKNKHVRRAIVVLVAAQFLFPAILFGMLLGNASAEANGSCGAITSGSYQPNQGANTPNPTISNIIYAVGKQRGVSEEVMKAAFIVAYIETEPGPRNQASTAVPDSLNFPHDYVTGGDLDSIGVFQQRAGGSGNDGLPWGTVAQIMDPTHAAGRFFDVAAVAERKGRTTYDTIAHFVQASAHPEKYKDTRRMQIAFGQLEEARSRVGEVSVGDTTAPPAAAPNGWVLPIAGNPVVSSGFGPRWGRMHNGTDYQAIVGTPILAINAGKVLRAGPQNPRDLGVGWGNVVFIDHGNQVTSVYAHLSQFKVSVGDTVTAGQVIALSGNTGSSTGPHLHLETWVNGNKLDPQEFLATQGAAAVAGGAVACSGVDGSLVDPGPGAQGSDNLTPRASNLQRVTEARFGCAAKQNVQPCVSVIGGWLASSASGSPDHPEGRALDVMVDLNERRATGEYEQLGNEVAQFMTANAAALGIDNVIWQQKIWTVNNPQWRPMDDRGSARANHFDHVHISVKK